jgi:hypothetical protein
MRESCPTCGLEAIVLMQGGQRICVKGHRWRRCPVHGTAVDEEPDFDDPEACSCPDADRTPLEAPTGQE